MKIFYQDDLVTLYNGHVLDVLRGMPAESVSCCVTSPPYWGLRDYGIEPQVWGGNDDCVHKWNVNPVKTSKGRENWFHPNGGTGDVKRISAVMPLRGMCEFCGAWIGCLGLEPTYDLYIEHMVMVFSEVRRVLRKDGTLWLNLGDSYVSTAPGSMGQRLPENDVLHTRSHEAAEAYKLRRPQIPAGLKPKDLIGIPWRVALALQASGWYLRTDIIWHKRNPMPESVKDRPTKSHEYIFLMSKSEKYYYDYKSIQEPASSNSHARIARAKLNHKSVPSIMNNGIKARKIAEPGFGIKNNLNFEAALREKVELRNKRSVWSITNKPYKGAHFATFPEDLITPCILAGTPICGIVLDPFSGAGTTMKTASKLRRKSIAIEIKQEYCVMSVSRLTEKIAI